MKHVGGKQCNTPCAALACGHHHRNGDIHRRCHNSLTHFLCFEETAVTQELVEIHMFLLKKNVHSNLQRTECREQMHAHKVRKCEATFRSTNEQWASFLKMRNVLT